MSFHQAPRCSHIKVCGSTCLSPALRGMKFCFFHARFVKEAQATVKRLSNSTLLESQEAVQVALIDLYRQILRGNLDTHRAELLLRTLTLAARNVRQTQFDHFIGRAEELPGDPTDYEESPSIEDYALAEPDSAAAD